MIISFAWTTPAFVLGEKTVTRRTWSDDYAERFKQGTIIQAYDKSPRAGGRKIGTAILTQNPYKEPIGKMPESDVAAEGAPWATVDDFVEAFGGDPKKKVWVVRFKLISLTDYGEELKAKA